MTEFLSHQITVADVLAVFVGGGIIAVALIGFAVVSVHMGWFR